MHIHTNQKNFEIEFIEDRDKWMRIIHNSSQCSPHLSVTLPIVPEEIVINGVLIQIVIQIYFLEKIRINFFNFNKKRKQIEVTVY